MTDRQGPPGKTDVLELVRTIEVRLTEAVKRIDDMATSHPSRAFVEHVMAPVRLALDDIKETFGHD